MHGLISPKTLVRYDAACRAVAECKSVDEAKDIRDKSVAMAAYAKQAKNKDLEADAVEIRMRATRRIDELIEAQRKTVGLNTGSRGRRVDEKPTLSQAGIDKNLAHQARSLGRLSPSQFEESIARTRKAVQRTVKIESDRTERMQNLAEISKGNLALGISRRFPVIYADPPWKYENPPIGATNRAIENHYPTMALEEICALPVSDLATDDAILFLWATAPKLAECVQVIDAWGFTYRTCAVWVKDKIGMGYHFRNQHELLLVGKRGTIPPPPPEARRSSVVAAPRQEHSAKPRVFYELIESMYPELPKIELFSRSPRDGWEAWGNQS